MEKFNYREYLTEGWMFKEVSNSDELKPLYGEELQQWLNNNVKRVKVATPSAVSGTKNNKKAIWECTFTVQENRVEVKFEDKTVWVEVPDINRKWIYYGERPGYLKAKNASGEYVLNLWIGPYFGGANTPTTSPEYKKYKPANLHGDQSPFS